jgi:RecA-family ATPase
VLSAEEKLKEMHRRVADILTSRGLSYRDLGNRLHFICDQDDITLGRVGRDGIVKPTKEFMRLEKTVYVIRPALVIIENAADVYAGNEIDRSNVTRFVRGMLGGLCKPSEAAMMLIQHPSVSGLQDGTGRSGSTAWNNSGRWRLNFTTLKSKDDDDAADGGLRQLHVIKSNYGPIGEEVNLKWDRGVFVPEGSISTVERAAAERKVDDVFLKCLRIKTAQGASPNSLKSSPYYAPKMFKNMRECDGITVKGFAFAMDRLLSAGHIKIGKTAGPPSKQKEVLVEGDALDIATAPPVARA